MKEAFYYMFKDDKFLTKYMMIFLLILLPFILSIYVKIKIIKIILLIVFMSIYLILSGYWINCVKAVTDQSNNIVLPFINIKNNIWTGLRWIFAELIFGIIALGVLILLGFLSTLPLMKFILIPVVCVAFILFYVLTNAFTWIFANKNDIYAYLRLSEAIKYLNFNKKAYFIILIICTLINVLCNILIKFAIVPYIMFLTAYLVAKSIKKDATL